jgi:hypothetical protein
MQVMLDPVMCAAFSSLLAGYAQGNCCSLLKRSLFRGRAPRGLRDSGGFRRDPG